MPYLTGLRFPSYCMVVVTRIIIGSLSLSHEGISGRETRLLQRHSLRAPGSAV